MHADGEQRHHRQRKVEDEHVGEELVDKIGRPRPVGYGVLRCGAEVVARRDRVCTYTWKGLVLINYQTEIRAPFTSIYILPQILFASSIAYQVGCTRSWTPRACEMKEGVRGERMRLVDIFEKR